MTVTAPTEAPAGEPNEQGPSEAVGDYQPGFDGMRAIAMIVILAYHSDLHWVPGAFLGLSQFLTLSGFLITSILLRQDARGGIGLSSFWSRRFRRLMPASLACLAMVMVFGATIADRQQADALPAQVFAATTYWVNWLFIIQKTSYVGLFASPSPVQHFWSLAIEEQFYLVLPVALVLLFRRTRSRTVLLGIFGGLAVASTLWMAYLYNSGAGLDRVYYGTDTRMAEMLVGSVLAVVLYHRGLHFSARAKRMLAVLSTIAFGITVWATMTIHLADGPIWTFGMLAYALVSATIILGVLAGKGPAAWILRLRPLPDIGRLTYGLYLYHWPIFLWLTPERTHLAPLPLFALRTATTFMVTIASFHLLEKPIRTGGRIIFRGNLRFAVAPVVMVLIVAGTYATVDHSAPDPLATLRNDSALTPPVQPTDGVLDMLVITNEQDPGVTSRIQKIASQGTTLRVTRAPFGCSHIEQKDGGPSCADWNASWPKLIADHDPDVVLFYVDDWSVADLQALGKLPAGSTTEATTAFATTILGKGFDLLSAKGAKVVTASSGTDDPGLFFRATQPFHHALANLAATRDDVRHVLGGRLPNPKVMDREAFVEKSAQALITDSSLYQRQGAGTLTKVLVLGDSQATSIGYGLERWGAKEHRALVWNAATEGCGITQEGTVHFGTVAAPVEERCKAAAAAWPKQIAEFDPDIVVVLSSVWDLRSRELAGSDRAVSPGDPAYDRLLVNEYSKAVDTFSAGGAKVVWMTAPCIELDAVTQAGPTGGANTRNIAYLDSTLLPELLKARPAVRLFDLAKVLCPGGKYVNAIDGIDPIRVDGAHFSVDGSLWFAQKYGDEVLSLGR